MPAGSLARTSFKPPFGGGPTDPTPTQDGTVRRVNEHDALGLPHGEPPTGQVAYVVADLVSAIDRWLHLGIGPWNAWTFDDNVVPTNTDRGAPAV